MSSTASCGHCGRHSRRPTRFRCSCSTRRVARRWCTSRCSSGCRRTRRCTASSGSRAPSRSAPPSTCRSCWRSGGNGPFILAGWSLGGALAYACAIGLRRAGADVPFVGLIDAVRAGEEIPQTKEETRARWDRYARFAERTFNVADPADPVRAAREPRRRGPGAVRAGRGQPERRADPRRHHRAPAHVVPGQPRCSTPRRSSRTTATSRSTWPTATTTTRSSSSRATPPASPTAAGANSSPSWRSCPSGASTSRRSTSRTLRRSART